MNNTQHIAASRRPRFQFTDPGADGADVRHRCGPAPGYYMMRGAELLPQSRLVGMLMLLAGPLFLMTVLSVFLSLSGRGEESAWAELACSNCPLCSSQVSARRLRKFQPAVKGKMAAAGATLWKVPSRTSDLLTFLHTAIGSNSQVHPDSAAIGN